MHNSPVTTGLDGVNLTIPAKISCYSILEDLFGLNEYQITWEDSPYKWYRTATSIYSDRGGMLVRLHTDSQTGFGPSHHLLEIRGLVFSDSAWNPFRPFDVENLVAKVLDYGANISKIDVYLDDFTAAISQESLNEMLQPHTYEKFVQSPFLRCKDGERPEPRPYRGSWYLGHPKRNSCEIVSYDKGKSPRQGVYSRDNPLKFTWRRFELRFTGPTSKRVGYQLCIDLARGVSMNICAAQLFRKYLRFVEYCPKNKRVSQWPLQDWYIDLLALAEATPHNHIE